MYVLLNPPARITNLCAPAGCGVCIPSVCIPSVWVPSASSANLLAHLEMIHHHSLKDHNVSPHFHKHTVVFIADGSHAVIVNSMSDKSFYHR